MRNHKGFTLIEMIMAITLIGIVAAIIAIPLSQGVKGWFQATSREGISQSGRIGIERMAMEIRNTARVDGATALCVAPGPPCPCISTADATTFIFNDINIDPISTACNSITFDISGSNLRRSGITLADNIQSLNINYYNRNNALLGPRPLTNAQIATICRLSIEVTSTQGGEFLQKYVEVYLSNMRSNCTP